MVWPNPRMDSSGDGNDDGAVLSWDGYAGPRARKGVWGILTIVHISVPPAQGLCYTCQYPEHKSRNCPKNEATPSHE